VRERRILWAVLAINAAFFAAEMAAGLASRSMGLVADSLDMLADAAVYALALWAVGGSAGRKRGVAAAAGAFQMVLAVAGFAEVVRRFVGGAPMPDFGVMMAVSALALAANVVCLWLLRSSRSEGAHMRASVIFSSNDVVINAGVIVAGGLVKLLGSGYPDLVVGAVVFAVVVRGAWRILALSHDDKR